MLTSSCVLCSWCPPSHLKLVADADEAEFSRLLLDVFAVVGVFEQFADEAVLGLADQTLQRHVQGIVVLLHKLGLKTFSNRVKNKLQRCAASVYPKHSFVLAST